MGAGHERSEPATPKRRERARREGDGPRSSIASVALGLVLVALPIACGERFASSWAGAFATSAALSSAAVAGEQAPERALAAVAMTPLWMPVLVAWCACVGAAAGAATVSGAVGWSPEALAWRPSRLSLVSGVRALANRETLTQTSVCAAAAIAVAMIAIPASAETVERFASSWRMTAVVAWQGVIAFWLRATASLCVIAAADVVFARRRHESRLRMTPREAREERAEQEGRPEVKARRRGIAIRRSRRIRIEAVRRAAAVIANPTHVAVALAYDPPGVDVPVVAAAGAGAAASYVRLLAAYYDVPVIESPELARALYARIDIDEPVHEEHFAAIAAIFAWLLRTRGRLGGDPPR